MKHILLFLIRVYRFFSRFTHPQCRFYPTCSAYAYEAIKRFGAFKGSLLTVKRLLKCHPFHDGGVDPVPEKL